MKRFISTALAVFLLLGLAGLAVLARPNGEHQAVPLQAAATLPQGIESAIAANASSDNALLAPEAPTGANKYNFIALPLDSRASISPFKAAGLASYIGSSVKKVVRFDPAIQGFKTHTVGGSLNNFDLAVGGAYLIEVDSTASSTVSFVGDVPIQGSVVFALTRGSSPTDCMYNAISVPLDRSDITNAAGLAAAIGGVNKVTRWDPTTQGFKTHTVGGSLNNFAVSIGYPFLVCVNSTGPASWP